MDFAENYAIENNYTSIRLDAFSNNPRALRFYENRDYQRRGEVFFPGRELPFYCFEKILK
jgi:ribosomal protein S18 acetylase RimI-like enzyme